MYCRTLIPLNCCTFVTLYSFTLVLLYSCALVLLYTLVFCTLFNSWTIVELYVCVNVIFYLLVVQVYFCIIMLFISYTLVLLYTCRRRRGRNKKEFRIILFMTSVSGNIVSYIKNHCKRENKKTNTAVLDIGKSVMKVICCSQWDSNNSRLYIICQIPIPLYGKVG